MHFDEGLARKIWHKSTPKPLQKAVSAQDLDATFVALASHLASRAMPQRTLDALAGDEPPLLWGVSKKTVGPEAVDLVRRLEHLAVCVSDARASSTANRLQKWSEVASEWLEKIESGPFGLAEAYETLAWSHALPSLAVLFATSIGKKPVSPVTCDRFSGKKTVTDGGANKPVAGDGANDLRALWWRLFETVTAIADEAETLTEGDMPLLSMLVTTELGMTLAYLFPVLEPCRDLLRSAKKTLNDEMTRLFDGEGLVEAKYFESMRPLLACWLRCEVIGSDLGEANFLRKDVVGQLEWAVRHTMRWTRSDGSQTLCDRDDGPWCRPLFEAALSFDEDDEDQDIATMTLPDWGKKAQIETLRKYALADAASHSEWARAAVLRADWEQAGPRFSILYPKYASKPAAVKSGKSPSGIAAGGFFVELENERQRLLSGEWRCQIQLGDKTLEPIDDWSETCWVSDEDIDYIEFQQDLTDGYTLQRQAALARDDRFLFLADTITGPGPGRENMGAKLRYTGSLPLVSDVVLEEDKESREIRMTGVKHLKPGRPGKIASRPAATMLPIGLSEWKAAKDGSLRRTSDGRLELSMTGTSHGLYVPLFIDLDVKRMRKPLTWRTLTVAESLKAVEPDVAVGYRVQIGNQQWLIYRSLDLAVNRTVLGENLIAETLLAQFDEDGQTSPLVMVQ